MEEDPGYYTGYDPNWRGPLSVDAPHINGGVYKTEQERAFILALDRCAAERGWNKSGLCSVFGVESSADLTFGVDIARHAWRAAGMGPSLRIDFHQGAVMVGKDTTGQFVSPLDEAHPLFAIKRDGTPQEQAVFAADWLDAQLAKIRTAMAQHGDAG